MMFRALSAVATVVLFASSDASGSNDLGAVTAARESIRKPDLTKHLNVLAGDSFEGREAGSRGGRAAAGYLVRFFQQYGLQPAGNNKSYFQTFLGGSRNILGLLPGSDPELSREIVLVGAHYDHVGYGSATNSYGPTGYIHNGADDNASGTSGVLETIEAFSKLPTAPRRSILFVLWDGEEKGLLGSKHWLRNPTVPLSRIKFAINIDMIGRLRRNRLELIGSRTSAGLRQRLSRNNVELGLWLSFPWKIEANSDHHPFFERGIPFVMLHTGLHNNYHRPSDDVETLNIAGTEQVSRFLFNLVNDLADGEPTAAFRTASRREMYSTGHALVRPLGVATPRLGVKFASDDEGGLLISSVRPGLAAARGGLRSGDRIVKFAGVDVADGKQFLQLVLAAENPVAVEYLRGDDEAPQQAALELAGKPITIGISWRIDPAEPGVAILSRVIGGSPAAAAGLRVGDRIDRVAGERFENSQQLVTLLTTQPGPVVIDAERRGQIRQVDLTPLAPLPAAESPEDE